MINIYKRPGDPLQDVYSMRVYYRCVLSPIEMGTFTSKKKGGKQHIIMNNHKRIGYTSKM